MERTLMEPRPLHSWAGGGLFVAGALMLVWVLAALWHARAELAAEAAPWVERGRRLPVAVLRTGPAEALAVRAAPVAKLPALAVPLFAALEQIALPTRSPVVAVVEAASAVWAGTFDDGLYRIAPGEAAERVTGVDARINDLATGPDGTIYVATNGGAFALPPLPSNGFTPQPTAHSPQPGATVLLSRGAFTSVAHFAGRAWVASRAGLSVVEGAGLRTLGPAQGVAIDHAAALEACGAALCVGASDGLWLFDGASARHADEAALPADWVTALACDGGALWVGTLAEGLALLPARSSTAAPRADARAFTPQAGLPDGRVLPRGLAVLAGGGALAATAGGLFFVAPGGFAPVDEPWARDATALGRSARGGTWVARPGALVRVDSLRPGEKRGLGLRASGFGNSKSLTHEADLPAAARGRS